jgi:hypothetical protein
MITRQLGNYSMQPNTYDVIISILIFGAGGIAIGVRGGLFDRDFEKRPTDLQKKYYAIGYFWFFYTS